MQQLRVVVMEEVMGVFVGVVAETIAIVDVMVEVEAGQRVCGRKSSGLCGDIWCSSDEEVASGWLWIERCVQDRGGGVGETLWGSEPLWCRDVRVDGESASD